MASVIGANLSSSSTHITGQKRLSEPDNSGGGGGAKAAAVRRTSETNLGGGGDGPTVSGSGSGRNKDIKPGDW